MLSFDSSARPSIKEVFERFRSLDRTPPSTAPRHDDPPGVAGPRIRGKGIRKTGGDRPETPPVTPPEKKTPASSLRGKGLEIAKK